LLDLLFLEKVTYSLNDFESGHYAIENSHSRMEVVHQRIGTIGGFRRMKQLACVVGNALLGCPYLG
jgi:hypothetical protein